MLSALQQKIGYTFREERHLDVALTHASFGASKENNERLEFLGDRVLALVIAGILFENFPKEPEGAMAKRLTSLVQQKTLVDVAKEIDLGAYLVLSPAEKKAGGALKNNVLGDAVEALIGAIYLDGGFDPARIFIQKHWREKITGAKTPPEDPKTALQEWAQARGFPLPVYRQIGKSGGDHAPVFKIEVSVEKIGIEKGEGRTKKLAEKEAAEKILKRISGGGADGA